MKLFMLTKKTRQLTTFSKRWLLSVFHPFCQTNWNVDGLWRKRWWLVIKLASPIIKILSFSFSFTWSLFFWSRPFQPWYETRLILITAGLHVLCIPTFLNILMHRLFLVSRLNGLGRVPSFVCVLYVLYCELMQLLSMLNNGVWMQDHSPSFYSFGHINVVDRLN